MSGVSWKYDLVILKEIPIRKKPLTQLLEAELKVKKQAPILLRTYNPHNFTAESTKNASCLFVHPPFVSHS